MKNLQLLIVDDEPLIRNSIRRSLSARNDVDVIGECESGSQAMHAIESLHPDLVLLDVQLHDCTGLEVVERIGPERMPPVIFVTAYDEYAVKAFELNAVDYLLKPFDDERLHTSLQRAQERISGRVEGELAQRLTALLETQRSLETKEKRWPERIVVRDGERFDLVPVLSIDWVESANNYVQLHCGPKQYLLGETLTNLEHRLNPGKFIRIHRCRMVNLSRILAIHPMFGGVYEIELNGGVRLPTGRQYKEQIRALLKS
jgi:two-component system LytT family response regulator